MMTDIGEMTGEWDYETLPKNVVIGRDCFLESSDGFRRFRSTRDPAIVLGNRVRAYTWTSFSIERDGQVVIGDDCVLVGALFMCGEQITLGNGVRVAYNVTIADCDFHPRDPDQRRLDALANAPDNTTLERPMMTTKPVVVHDGVKIGIGAIILKGVTIGAGAEIAAGAVVTTDVPPGARFIGNPAQRDGRGPSEA